MAELDGDLSTIGSIDFERVIIDPDYRRRVIALLREMPVPGEVGALPPVVATAPAEDRPAGG